MVGISTICSRKKDSARPTPINACAPLVGSLRQETNTQPLYQCYSDAEHSHFAANRPDCDGKGRMETLLGYDLVQ
jgi:hypothetical protein